ncbi:transcription antitermination factor NusB [Desnuesiella massiliensis]|uniref:transcription antitermination factor NusB n=1 Tax=Desnuesiella massiliensis TaxID=1650662 RepID=UPI0006E2B0E4|nr:transcription antitermination factor NusB [Desnuesiella massiliensis]
MNRKKSREVAMEILFQRSINKENVEETIREFRENTEHDLKDLDFNYISRIITGVEENLETIDNTIEKFLLNWKMSRLSKVDLSILRLATYEIIFEEDIPEKVSINEALELTKKYSEEGSVSFINGVLDRILKNR